jgi:CheY-like chemotaxis protein
MAVVTVSVLVIDDHHSFRALIARMLRSWGYAVVDEAESVADGLARTMRVRPDAVLVDLSLPDGDGLALAARIAAQPWQPRVVVVSSDAEAVDDAAIRRAGAVGFVPKDHLLDRRLRSLIDPGPPKTAS